MGGALLPFKFSQKLALEIFPFSFATGVIKMPLSDPALYRDKREDWLEKFREIRCAALRQSITPQLIEEHRGNPRGPHSVQLQLVLNLVRGPLMPMNGKTFAYVRVPFKDYAIGHMTPRGEPCAIDSSSSYSNEDAAQHAAFINRLAVLGLHVATGGSAP